MFSAEKGPFRISEGASRREGPYSPWLFPPVTRRAGFLFTPNPFSSQSCRPRSDLAIEKMKRVGVKNRVYSDIHLH